MDFKQKTNNKILIIAAIILTLLYILSFTRTFSQDKRKLVKSALVNNKYSSKISSFQIISGNNSINLNKKISKNKEIWFIQNQDNENILPADSKIVENFIQKLCEVQDMYKISAKINKNNSYGILEDNAFHIFYKTDDNQEQNEIIFGNHDFTKTMRYIMSGKNTTVYQISNNLDSFLNTNLQYWCEPYIISKIYDITPETIQKIKVVENEISKIITKESSKNQNKDFVSLTSRMLELRHGGPVIGGQVNIAQIQEQKSQMQLQIENGDKTNIKLLFYPYEEDYCVNCIYPEFSTLLKISKWTYNKYKEIML